jgi:hypothetical protein
LSRESANVTRPTKNILVGWYFCLCHQPASCCTRIAGRPHTMSPTSCEQQGFGKTKELYEGREVVLMAFITFSFFFLCAVEACPHP